MRCAILGLLLIAVTACSGGIGADNASDTGKKACTMYADEMSKSPEAIVSYEVMPDLKAMLPDMDKPTRRAFAGLITAANDFDGDTDGKAATVREVCLAEHGVEVPTY